MPNIYSVCADPNILQNVDKLVMIGKEIWLGNHYAQPLIKHKLKLYFLKLEHITIAVNSVLDIRKTFSQQILIMLNH